MEVNKLSRDELEYELMIRGFGQVQNEHEMKTVLKGLLRVELGNTVEVKAVLNPKDEIATCVSKVRELKNIVDAVKGTRLDDSYRNADTKITHLLGRIERIVTNDPELQKTRSVLLKTILHFTRELEFNVNKNESNIPVEENQIDPLVSSVTMSTTVSLPPSPSTVDDGSEVGHEIFSHQGVALKKKSEKRQTWPTGILSIIHYKSGKWVEWRHADVAFESNNDEQEWDVVDAVRKRTMSTSSNQESPSGSKIRLAMADIRSYKIKNRGRQISLMHCSNIHYTFLFQCGNADSFIAALRAFLNTKRATHKKNLYIVINERDESASLNRSFNELNLFPDQRQPHVWNFVRNFHNSPYETTMQTFSKLTDVLLYRQPEQRPMDEDVAELLTKSFHALEDNDSTFESEYTIVEEYDKVKLPPQPSMPRGAPLSQKQWDEATDEEGRVIYAEEIKSVIFKGGIEPTMRYKVWKYLLGYYPWDYTTERCEILRKEKETEYLIMKNQWKTMTLGQEERFSGYRDRKSLIEKDVNRTDRTIPYYAGDKNPNLQVLSDILMTYVMYNFDLGYVQGMSDLLSPILSLLENEVDAFWCFVGFMNRVHSNFEMDQSGMKQQLSQLFTLLRTVVPELATYLERHDSSNMFFCFRWLLVLFKREFSHSEIMTLWEVLWTQIPCINFHLLMCVAILDMQKEELMKPENGFTEILKHVNDLSQKMDLPLILGRAEGTYYQLKAVSDLLSINVKRIIGLAPCENTDDNSDEESSRHSGSTLTKEQFEAEKKEEENFEKSINSNYL